MRIYLRLVACMLLVLSAAQVVASDAAKDRPFHGMRLRGINAVYKPDQPLTDEDFKKLSGWGVNSIRLAIHCYHTWKDSGLIKTDFPLAVSDDGFAKLKKTLDLADKYKIKVVMDMHGLPGKGDDNMGLYEDFKYWTLLNGLWKEIATRVGNHPAVIGYDLLNEPNANRTNEPRNGAPTGTGKEEWSPPKEWTDTPRDYNLLVKRLTDTIRSVDKRTTIIIEGGWVGGTPNGLTWVKPTGDPNTVYSFHMYLPHNFTQQGTDKHPNNALGVKYPSDTLTKKDIYDLMQPAVDFAKKNHVQLYVGEFGATRFAENLGAAQWDRDVIEFFESHGWHWAVHCYGTGTGWNPELGTDPDSRTPVPGGTPRLKVLQEFWKRNAK